MKTTALALEHLLCAVGDPIRELHGIGPEHPEFMRAQVLRAASGVLAKAPEALPAIAQTIRSVAAAPMSPRVRTHLAAAEAWLDGNPVLAAESYAWVLDRWPTDLLALRLAQSCYFFLGRHDRLCDVVDAAAPAWTRDERGYRLMLAMTSFAYSEAGDTDRAEALGRESLSYEPGCPMGVHAVAHAFAESGRHAAGARWMRDQHAHWATESRMRTHNAWHLAMFDAEDGNVASALAILDETLLPASREASLDACDAVGLLWRLTLAGVEDDGRWLELSDAFERSTTPGFWSYVDLHAALAHVNAGQLRRAQALEEAIEYCAQRSDYAGLRARLVTRPALRALDAYAEGRYAEAAGKLGELRCSLTDAGGSRVQLQVFESVEREAARRQRALPSERLAA
jgi:tetratricopeptide (TPR) repeat protein